jgi:hypothetical protein
LVEFIRARKPLKAVIWSIERYFKVRVEREGSIWARVITL